MIYVRFWIRSSRGTDAHAHRVLDLGDEIEGTEHEEGWVTEALEDWCQGFGAWHVSENHVSYGYEVVGRNLNPKA